LRAFFTPQFLNINDILSPFQSGFRKQHSTISDWFANYLSGRTQSVRVAGSVSSFLPIYKGVQHEGE